MNRSVTAVVAVLTAALMAGLYTKVPPSPIGSQPHPASRTERPSSKRQGPSWAPAQAAVDYPIRRPSWLPGGMALKRISVIRPPLHASNPKHMTQVDLLYADAYTGASLDIRVSAFPVTMLGVKAERLTIAGFPAIRWSLTTPDGRRVVFVMLRTNGVTYLFTGSGVSPRELEHIARSMYTRYRAREG